MYIVEQGLLVLTILLATYAYFPALSIIASRLIRLKEPFPVLDEMSFACIITAYKDFKIALPQIDSILKQEYSNYRIYLIADRCEKPELLPTHPRLSILFPEQPLNSKVLSIKFAMDHFTVEPDAVLILDSDNLLHPLTLGYFNDSFSLGYIAVQGQRTAKNLNNTVSALDAMSELYYNTIQREIPFRIGSSATIAGSGMAIKTWYFRNYIEQLFKDKKQYEIAEDKLLQMMLVKKGHQIAYNKRALIFDEKVMNGTQVQRQRTRWIRSWFQHWKSAMGLVIQGIREWHWNIFYFGIMLSFPPMFLLLGGLLISIGLSLWLNPILAFVNLVSLGIFVLQFFAILAISNTPIAIWKAIPKIPSFIWRQVMAVLKIKESKNDFMATDHSQHIDIEDVWHHRRNDFPYMKREANRA
jgi:cellulose synthase/poly-beta-1,6-N-acetylglucosamine synthase-like glycosyltransferase